MSHLVFFLWLIYRLDQKHKTKLYFCYPTLIGKMASIEAWAGNAYRNKLNSEKRDFF